MGLKNLQQQKGLKADGKIGPKTLAATDQAKISGEARSSAPSGDVPNFTAWAKPSTRATQKALGIADDGKEGPNTTEAIKAFQKAQGVKQDGVLGPETPARPGCQIHAAENRLTGGRDCRAQNPLRAREPNLWIRSINWSRKDAKSRLEVSPWICWRRSASWPRWAS